MQEATFLPKDTNTIQKLIITFSTLTNVELFFYSTNKMIISGHQILNTSQDIYNYLTHVNFKKVTAFPVILDNALSGFFILNVSSTLKEQVMMYRSYLDSTSGRLDQGNFHHLMVLNALDPRELQNYIGGLSLISDSTTSKDAHHKLHIINKHDKGKVVNVDKNFVNVLKYINANISKPLTLEDIAQHVYLSPSYLSRLFKNYFNVNFIDYINIRKVALAQERLALSVAPINELSHRLGFSQASYFTKIFKQKCGMTPSKYRMRDKKIKKIYTISRDLSWLKDPSVYTVSQKFFDDKGIDFKTQDLSDSTYVYAIGDLSSDENNGWIYTVNCIQPTTSPVDVSVGDKSVIQWIYTGIENF